MEDIKVGMYNFDNIQAEYIKRNLILLNLEINDKTVEIYIC